MDALIARFASDGHKDKHEAEGHGTDDSSNDDVSPQATFLLFTCGHLSTVPQGCKKGDDGNSLMTYQTVFVPS